MKTLKLHTLHTLVAGAALAAFCAIASAPAVAAEAAHDHGASIPSKLSLDHGRKWATDEPLRAGMTRMRALVEPQLGAAHTGKLKTADYQALAGQIETEVGNIVANCKLDPKADAMFHLVIGEIGAGTDAMAGKNPKMRPQQGLVHVAAAINNYRQYFDHPDFKPIHVGH